MTLLPALLTMTAALLVALVVQLNAHSTDTYRSSLERGVDLRAQMAYAWIPRLRDVKKSDPVGAVLAASILLLCLAIGSVVVNVSVAELNHQSHLASWTVHTLSGADLLAVIALALRALAVGLRKRVSESESGSVRGLPSDELTSDNPAA